MASLRSSLLLLLMLMVSPAWASPSVERQDQLRHRVKHDCGSCHGLTLKGGLGPPLVPAALADRAEESLVEIILRGVPGTPMPPWAFEISPQEAGWLVRQLKEGF